MKTIERTRTSVKTVTSKTKAQVKSLLINLKQLINSDEQRREVVSNSGMTQTACHLRWAENPVTKTTCFEK